MLTSLILAKAGICLIMSGERLSSIAPSQGSRVGIFEMAECGSNGQKLVGIEGNSFVTG